MVTLIQNMTRLYQGRTISQYHEKLENLEDICRLDQQFYSQMLIHKSNRLNKRKEMLSQTVTLVPNPNTIAPSCRSFAIDPDLHSQLSE